MTGQHTLNRLLDDGGFDPVVALLRTPLRRTHPRLQERVVDFDALASLAPVPIGVAFCCLGTTIRKAGSQEAFRAVDYGYTIAFAKWARASGATRFLLQSSVGAELDSGNFYLRVKAETERDLALLGFEQLDIFQPSILLGTRAESRPMERVGQAVAEALGWALTGSLQRFRGIAASTVAAAMVARANATPEPGVWRWEWQAMMELSRKEDAGHHVR